ncbi:MAG: hypothetical protein ACOZB0_04520 [Pseudomonadota bacterium]
MSSVQRFLHHGNNAVSAATLTASNVRPARAVSTLAADVAGSGRVRLVGDYTGHADSEIEIAILAGGGTARASTPALSGVGNGTLSVVDVDPGATAQTLILSLSGLGTTTTQASLTVGEVSLRARLAGAGGNAIHITVTPDLSVSDTEWSLLDEWPAGASQVGEQWSFGALPLLADGRLDAATPRLRIGSDAQVYRPYREFADGQWRIGLSPAPQRTLPAGDRVRAVSGGYDVTVSDGVTTTVHEDVVTLYDLLTALVDDPLIEAAGVVSDDRTPGGMAAIDLPLRTAAWLLSSSGVAVSDLAIASDAPTEVVTIECINADAVNSEIWSVTGSVSGAIGQATTGIAFAGDPVGFTIPSGDASSLGVGKFSTRFVPVARDTGDLGIPSVCVRHFTLGVNARPGTFTFTYKERPNDSGCDCNSASLRGRIRAACLGLDGGLDDMALDINYASRLQSLYGWRNTFIAGQIAIVDDALSVPIHYQVDELDIRLCDGITAEFADALADEIWADAAASTEWDAAFTQMQSDMADWATNRVEYIRHRRRMIGNMTSSGSVDESGFTDATAYSQTTTAIYDNTLNRPLVHIDHYDNYDISPIVGRWRAWMDKVRALAGIVPKSNASTGAGDGCWRDDPTATHWWVDEDGVYFPAFSSTAYISSAQSCGSGASAGIPSGEPYSTREFGMFIAVGCTERLKVGDQVVIHIESVDGRAPYAVGDTADVQIVAAGPAYLTGGVTGDDTLTWSVSGSLSGALPDYELTSDEPDYTQAGVTLQLNRGGIPWALGDTYTLDIAAAQYQWRRDGGAWSTPADIDGTDQALADGLSVRFEAGSAPVWLDGDTWHFLAQQPYAPANLLVPTVSSWSWTGAAATLVVDLGGETDIEALAIARYDLPSGATLTIEGGDGATWTESAALPIGGPVAVAMLAVPWSVSRLRLSVANATGGSIGWLWAGVPLATTYSAGRCRIARAYAVARGDGVNPGRQYLGQGRRGELAWTESSPLSQADLDALLAMLDGMQASNYPMVLVPHHLHPAEAGLVRVGADSIDPIDYFELHPNDTTRRVITLDLSLEAVFQ